MRKNHEKRNSRRSAAALLLGLCTVMALGFAACGDSKEAGSDSAKGSQEKEQQKDKADDAGYAFEANGVTMKVDMDMADISGELGEPASTFEEPSCAAQGTAYIYTYPGFQITTYPDGDKNLIGYITLKDDTVATPEGIDLSKSKEDVIAAYGDDYTGDERQLSYQKGNMTLNFIFEGDSIASIEYASSVMTQ